MAERESWEECPSGVLTGMAEELRRRQSRRHLLPAVGGLLLLVAIGGILATRFHSPSGAPELTCSEVIPLLAQYHDDMLSATMMQRVEQHLSDCPNCKDRYSKAFPADARREHPKHHLEVEPNHEAR